MRAVLSLVLSLFLLACSGRMPQTLRAGEASPLSLSEALTGRGVGERVRWGGTIAIVHVRERETCLEIVARRLDSSARPIVEDASEGRFWACRSDFLDPEIYVRGRSITVVGVLRELHKGSIGERSYRFPVVQAEELKLWPVVARRTTQCACPASYVVDPWLWGPPYWWPSWYGGKLHR
ncbi:MAG: Slp family lipoprotein [Candidatus Binatia bacterium]|nr:Slp family lipoprotein [Candidatus Binatia bacterium]